MKAEPTTLTIEGEILNEQKTINIYYEIKIIAFSYYLIHIINYTKKKDKQYCLSSFSGLA